MKNTKVWISELEFRDGTKVGIAENDIVVFVGANNAGKSISLKEISKSLQSKTNNGKIIENITIDKLGTQTELIEFIKSISKNYFDENGQRFHGFSFSFYESYSKRTWDNFEKGLGQLYAVFANTITT